MKKIVIRFNAPVILAFALLRLLALLLGQWTDGAATSQYFSVYRASLSDPLTYVRFFGHVLGHADYEHYMGNMLLILLVGPGLEEKYGSGTMVSVSYTHLDVYKRQGRGPGGRYHRRGPDPRRYLCAVR